MSFLKGKNIEALNEKIQLEKSVIGFLQGELNYFLEAEFNEKLDKSIKQAQNGETYRYSTAREMIEDSEK